MFAITKIKEEGCLEIPVEEYTEYSICSNDFDDTNKEHIKKCKFKFRLLDDDDNVYAEGISDDDSSFEPLDDFAMPSWGCTAIQYKVSRKWEYL